MIESADEVAVKAAVDQLKQALPSGSIVTGLFFMFVHLLRRNY